MNKDIRPPDNSRVPLLAICAIRAAAARAPAKVAIRGLNHEGSRTEEISYGLLVERMDRLGQAALGSLGLSRGDNVAILAPNCIAFLEVSCGISAAGVAVATLSHRLRPAEVTAILEDCAAKILFLHPRCVELVEPAAAKRVRIVTLDEDYERLLSEADLEPLPAASLADETSAFVIPYTSGTTGRPKGVVVSHRSRSLCCHAMGIEYGCFGPDDRFLALAPLAHGAGFVMALAALFFGGRCDLLEGFNPEAIIRMLHEREHSGVFFVPTHFQAIFALDPNTLANFRGNGLKTIISNAAPLPQEVKVQIVEYFGEDRLHECYGSTEAGIVTNLRPAHQLRKQRCVGQPFPGTLVRLVNDQGRPAAAGEVGELFSRSVYTFNGYWQMPEETAAALNDGWVTAGDLAVQDEEGYYYIVDRKKDMIITGGLNVYPREIEEVLSKHMAIGEVAVAGIEDSYWGERVTAFITLEDESISDEELTAFCAERLADYKRPREFRRVDRLPRNTAGKVLKRMLRDAEAKGEGGILLGATKVGEAPQGIAEQAGQI